MAPRNPQFSLYLPRTLLAWQAAEPDQTCRCVEGTTLFADISGFTPLVERMSALGRAGSEEVSDLINSVFDEIIAIGHDEGGDVLKFGGDACLMLFTGDDHVLRAARTALDMQAALEDFDLPEFGISIGIESGEIHLGIAGELHRELLVLGPAINRTLEAEKIADTGQVAVGPTAAAHLPAGSVDGGLLVDVPDGGAPAPETEPRPGDHLDLSDFVPVRLRDTLSVAGADSEHRHAAAGFVKVLVDVADFDQVPFEKLHRLTTVLQRQAERHEVGFLGCDVEIGAVKFLLCAGAPTSPHLEEERMLRTLRRVMDEFDELPLQMGVTRGLLFAGDIGATSRRYYSLLGDSVNLAARLMAAAQPGQILTLDNVLERSPTRFLSDRLDPLALKGKSKPVAPLAIGAIAGIERIDWARFLPLTGRDGEMKRLVAALSAVRSGTGGVIEIAGESGVGKTRLMGELLDRATSVDTHQLICQHYETSTPYFIAGHLIRGVLALKPDSDPLEVEMRLDEVLDEAPELEPWRPLLALPLDLEVEDTPETEALSPEFRATKMHEVVEELVALVRPEASIFAIEDAHWIDEASQGLLHHLMRASDRRPWLFIVSHHSSGVWRPVEGSEVIELEPLTEHAVYSLVRIAARETPVSDQMLDSIVERSGGHPFFALELLRHADAATLPESVETVIAERIDRLEARDRQLLRYVSVLGNSFAFDLLAEALPQVAPSAEDNETWQRLSEFLDVTVFGNVQFRQDLIRLAAYEGLTYKRRREVHGIIGDAVERRARRRANRQAALLAQHFHLAERWDKAWQYALVGAEQAGAASAVVDAMGLYERALEAARHVDSVTDAEIASVHESLGDMAQLAGVAERAVAAFGDAMSLIGADTADAARLLRKQASAFLSMGEAASAEDRLAQSLSIAEVGERSGESPTDFAVEATEALVGQAGLLHRNGDFEGSNERAFAAIERAEAIGAKRSFAGAALIVVTNSVELGTEPERDLGAEALSVFEELGDAYGQARVLNNLGYRDYYRGRWEATVSEWERAGIEYRRAGDAIGAATTENNMGEVLSDQGRLDEAEHRFEEALRAWRAARFPVGIALATQNLGRLAGRRDDVLTAKKLLEEALARFDEVGAAAFVADTRVRLAEMHAHGGRLKYLDSALRSLPPEVDTPTLAPVRRRLEALVAVTRGDDDAASKMAVAVKTAREADLPFELAQTLRVAADAGLRLDGDIDPGREAEEILVRLDALDAVPLRVR